MKNYILYDKNGQMLRRFDTQEEGEAYARKLAADWQAVGRPCPLYRLCYNGTTSVEVFRIGG